MSFFKKWLVSALVLTSSVNCAWAQLYSRDSEFGANTVVADTRTGLSWLQLNQSTGLALADFDIPEDYNPNAGGYDWTVARGTYAGYRIATRVEVSALVSDYVFCALGPDACISFSWSDFPRQVDSFIADSAFDLVSLIGGDVTTSADGGQRGYMGGMVVHGGWPQWPMWFEVTSGPSGNFLASDRFSGPRDVTFLIAPVPEPSTYALMLAGLACVALVARRRRGRTSSV